MNREHRRPLIALRVGHPEVAQATWSACN